MDYTKEVEKIRQGFIDEYNGNKRLQREFISAEEFSADSVQAQFDKLDFEASEDLQKEYGIVERYVSFQRAFRQGKVGMIRDVKREKRGWK